MNSNLIEGDIDFANERPTQYWCHMCQKEFTTLPLINQEIHCVFCAATFCEAIAEDELHPSHFQPYCRQPEAQSEGRTSGVSSNSGSGNSVNRTSRGRTSGGRTNTSTLESLIQRIVDRSLSQPGSESTTIIQLGNAGFGNSFTSILGDLLAPRTENGMSFDQLVQYLIENDPNRYGTPPASETAIGSLPKLEVTEDFLSDLNLRECSVCKEDFELQNQVNQMPCKHVFHPDCLTPWLKIHNSCPTCRFELPTDDADYESEKVRRQTNTNTNSNTTQATSSQATEPNSHNQTESEASQP